MGYNIQKLAPYIQKYNTVSSTSNLEIDVRTMLSGITANSNFALDGQIKELLFVGGKNKPRSPLRDHSVTEVEVPRVFNDDEIYIESIVNVINRYFDSIKINNSQNKVKSILVKLLSNNVSGFYNRFNLPRSYQMELNCIFKDLITASNECLNRFKTVVENEEWKFPKLPPRFEYKKLTPEGIYDEYFKDLNCDAENFDTEMISEFMSDISEIDISEDEDEVGEIEQDSDYESMEVDKIKSTLEQMGFKHVITTRPDAIMWGKFGKLKGTKEFNNLFKILKGFRTTYLRLTASVWTHTYRQMFKLSASTYRDNRNIVIKEIFNISNSEEFARFKQMLLE